jgi:hypothetical protein
MLVSVSQKRQIMQTLKLSDKRAIRQASSRQLGDWAHATQRRRRSLTPCGGFGMACCSIDSLGGAVFSDSRSSYFWGGGSRRSSSNPMLLRDLMAHARRQRSRSLTPYGDSGWHVVLSIASEGIGFGFRKHIQGSHFCCHSGFFKQCC